MLHHLTQADKEALQWYAVASVQHSGEAVHVQAEAQSFIASSDCPEYLKKAERRLGEEVDRVANYLDSSSEAHITKVVETELIGKQVGHSHHSACISRATVRAP